jgi:hypothetical protein
MRCDGTLRCVIRKPYGSLGSPIIGQQLQCVKLQTHGHSGRPTFREETLRYPFRVV